MLQEEKVELESSLAIVVQPNKNFETTQVPLNQTIVLQRSTGRGTEEDHGKMNQRQKRR